MQPLLFPIDNPDMPQDTKRQAQYMARIMWQFGIKIAEKMFLFGQDGQDYAKKILFFELHNTHEALFNLIEKDFKKHNISYDITEINLIIQTIHTDYSINSVDKCFYI